MTAWRPIRSATPPRGRCFLIRRDKSCLPQVSMESPRLPGYHLSFAPFEGGPAYARGVYRDTDDLVREGWEWTDIPE